MNYRHTFHAGNFADVFKHVVLIELIESLKQKDKPFCYLDTHAGRGLYDLKSEAAEKTLEYENGVARLLNATLSESLQKYVALVMSCNSESLRYYPGSPYLVKNLLREADRMVLSELHEEEYQLLKDVFYRDRQVAMHHLDAYLGLKAFLPPTLRRGLVLIDAPFELKDEFKRIIDGLKQALKRWDTGIYAIWYPIKDKLEVQAFIKQVKILGKPYLNMSLQPFADDYAFGLNATGMLIINPPWQFDKTMDKILPELWRVLSVNGQGNYHSERGNSDVK